MKNRGYGIFGAAIAVGALSGLICVAFRGAVGAMGGLRPLLFNHNNPTVTHFAVFSSIFAALYITGWLVKKFPKISGSGLPQTQALMYGRRIYNRPFTYLVVKFAGGLLSLCSGLSLGREGTSVQMGSLTGYIAAAFELSFLATIGEYVLNIGFLTGLGFNLYALKKYNKGIF